MTRRQRQVTRLGERFASLVRRLGGAGDVAAAAEALLAAWGESSRTYHGTPHLVDCLRRLDEVPTPVAARDLVEAALWYHDGVYDPHAGDNEARSAAWARCTLGALGVCEATTHEIARLVLVTRHADQPVDDAARLVSDIDLSILGRSPVEFAAYEAAIRAEYAWVPEEAFHSARRRVLSSLLAREPLYGTPHFGTIYEEAARANLRRALIALDSAGA